MHLESSGFTLAPLTESILSLTSSLPSPLTPSSLVPWYQSSSTDPLHPAILFSLFMSVVVYVLSEITGNVSQVDRLWTFLPIVYSAHFALWDKDNPRMLLLLGLQLLWSARLTTNTYRRGFFNPSSEDYRWPFVRKLLPPWLFRIFNVVFIAFTQNVLLLAVELPLYYILRASKAHKPLTPIDLSLSALFVLTLAVEMVADNQQQAYQRWKTANSDNRGFVTRGLWAYSRHPNFACEQFTWWILYAFTTPIELVNYSIIGPISMSLLFFGSTLLTEYLSSQKYPNYIFYQKRVGMFWPPLTLWKSLWCLVTGQKQKVDSIVWGHGEGVKSAVNGLNKKD